MTGIGLAVAFLAGATVGWPACIAVACAGVALLAATDCRRRSLAPVILVGLGGLAGALRGVPPPEPVVPSWVDAATTVRGHVVAAPAATGRFWRLVVRTSSVRIGDGWQPATGTVCVTAPAYPETELGDEVRLGGRPESALDGSGGYRASLRERGCGVTMFAEWASVEATGGGWRRWPAVAGRSLGHVLRRAVPGDAGALLTGLVTGDDAALSPERQERFRLTGTTHLTAVSGANVALLLTIVATAGHAVGTHRRLPWQVATIGVVWAYALVTGLGAPVIRAALVATGALLASRPGRRPDHVTLVLLAGAVSVAAVPTMLWSLSFQLSLASSLALALVVPSLRPVGGRGWLRASLLVVAAAQVATLPLLLPISGTASLIATPANLIVGPIVDVAFPLAALGALLGLVWAPLGELALFPAGQCAAAILAVVDVLAELPLSEQTGGLSQTSTVAVWVAAAVAVTGLSGEGRLWARRLPAALRTTTATERVAWVGAAGAALLVVVAVTLGS